MKNKWFISLLIVITIALLYLPFINKAIHIDDTTFITMSRAINNESVNGDSMTGYFLGNKAGRIHPRSSIHPIVPFVLKFIKVVFGNESEFIYHMVFLIFPLLLSAGIYGICAELDLPFYVTFLFIIGNAAYLPVSHTIMADGPTLSFLVLSLYLFIKGQRVNSNMLMAASSFIMIIAVSFSYQSVFLYLLFLMYLLVYNREKKVWIALFAIPLLFLSGLFIYVKYFQNISFDGMITEAMRGMRKDILLGKVLSILIGVGTISLFLNPLLFIKDKDKRSRLKNVYIIACSVVLSLVSVAYIRYSIPENLWVALLLASGIGFLLKITFEMLVLYVDGHKKIIVLMYVWLYIVFVYNIIFMPFGALRYMLPVLVPIVVMSIFMLKQTNMRIVYISAILTVMVGIAVSYGDYIFASSYRDIAAKVSERVGKDNKHIWFVGDWGMQYYMRRGGYQYLTADSNDPQKGDLIFIADKQKMWGPSPELYSRMELIDIIEERSWFPIRVMAADMRVGYYSHLWGLQPFTLSSGPVERFGVFRVVR